MLTGLGRKNWRGGFNYLNTGRADVINRISFTLKVSHHQKIDRQINS